MRLQLVNSGRPFLVQCVGCGEEKWAGEVEGGNPVFADLDGKAFEAYYCHHCAPNGCGKTIRVVGTNGGSMPCGGNLTDLNKITTRELCVVCGGQNPLVTNPKP